MKKLATALFILVSVFSVLAQDVDSPESNWKKGGDFTLTFSQVSFSNWAAGGKNSVSGVGLLNYSANYAKDRLNWDNTLNLGYGLLKEGNNDLIKSEDKLDLSSKFGYKMNEEGK